MCVPPYTSYRPHRLLLEDECSVAIRGIPPNKDRVRKPRVETCMVNAQGRTLPAEKFNSSDSKYRRR